MGSVRGEAMVLKTCFCIVGMLLCCLVATIRSKSSIDGHVFTSSFLVKFKRNVDDQQAHEIADRNGFINLGPVSSSQCVTMGCSVMGIIKQMVGL